jgi:hypothetical protein
MSLWKISQLIESKDDTSQNAPGKINRSYVTRAARFGVAERGKLFLWIDLVKQSGQKRNAEGT